MKSSALCSLSSLLLIVAGVGVVAGCSKKATQAPPQSSAAPPMRTAQVEPPKPVAPPAAPSAPAAAALSASELEDAYFDFNMDNLRDDARVALDADAKLLRDHPGAKIRIEGHCDERGTIEYNVALGQRRANAARDYLITSGVNASAISTVSYGKDRPFCTEHAESCWSKNRCAHVTLPNGPA